MLWGTSGKVSRVGSEEGWGPPPLSLWSRYSRKMRMSWTMVRISAPKAREPTWYLPEGPGGVSPGERTQKSGLPDPLI